MKILITPTSFRKPVNAKARKRIEEFADEVVYNETGKPLRGEELIRLLEGVDGYIAGVDYIDEQVIAAAPPSLRVISRYGSGVDRVDLAACSRRKIQVTNTPGVNSVAVAELAFALMLSVARDIPQMHEGVQNGEWPRGEGLELKGKSLGIVGLGAIGKMLAVRARAFEMTVRAYDPYFDEAFAKLHGIAACSLEEALYASDFISLHVPLNEQTRNLVSRERIAQMKKGAVIINTARGGLIDEAAAAEALKEGRLGGLGLDAFEQEPLVDSPLKGLKGVVFTPHTGAHTAEAVERMGEMAVENCMAVLRGEHCRYTLNG